MLRIPGSRDAKPDQAKSTTPTKPIIRVLIFIDDPSKIDEDGIFGIR
jgi:hypothetical protein